MISFLGVCTWFNDLRQYAGDRDPSTLPPRRMVLMNTNRTQLCQGHGDCVSVDPHIAKIEMFYDQIIERPSDFPPALDPDPKTLIFEPNGMTVQVLNPRQLPVLPAESNHTAGLPSLASQAGLTPEDLGPPSSGVFDRDPRKASVYFDVDAGNMTAYTPPKVQMGITQLVVDCDGDPIVAFEPWQWDRGPWIVKLRHAEGHEYATINVMNFSAEKTGPAVDFYLQYLAVESFPGFPRFDQIKIPQTIQLPVTPFTYHLHQSPAGDVDPGCSNSNYP
jgi:hypothetical protein